MMITPCSTETQINSRTAGSTSTGAMPATLRRKTQTRNQKCVSTAGGNSDQIIPTSIQRGTDVRGESQEDVRHRAEHQQQVEATKRSGLQQL